MVTITCNTCTTLASLQAAAQNYYNAHINGPAPGYPIIPAPPLGNVTYYVRSSTQALVTSTQIPISATFAFSSPLKATTATTDLGAYNLDQVAYARADGVPIIVVPLPPNTDPDENIVTAIQVAIPVFGVPGMGSLWNLLQGKLTVYYTLANSANGQVYKVYVGDDITVKYSDGSTEKWQFLGPEAGSVQWKKVPGTYKPAKPTNPPPTSSAAPGAGFQVGSPTIPGLDSTVIVVTPYSDNLPHGTVVVGDPIPGSEKPVVAATTEFDAGGGWFGDCDCNAPD